MRNKTKYDNEYDEKIESISRKITGLRGEKEIHERSVFEVNKRLRSVYQIASAICEGYAGEERVLANIEGTFREDKVKNIVVSWAKRRDLLYDENETRKLFGEPIERTESRVYLTDDGLAVKFTDCYALREKLSEYVSSIDGFNDYFSLPYTFIGVPDVLLSVLQRTTSVLIRALLLERIVMIKMFDSQDQSTVIITERKQLWKNETLLEIT